VANNLDQASDVFAGALSPACFADAIKQGHQLLQQCSESAKRDAQILLCFVLNKPSSYLFTWPEKRLEKTQQQQYNQLLQRRLQGEPVAYITGVREFWSLSLKVSPATLIPRPDTEILVEQVLATCPQQQRSCLDLGTGTGAIALALASEMPQWSIEALDFNPEAVALAQHNAQMLNLSQVSIYQSSWFEKVDDDKKFDIIVSNPPYIDDGDQHLSQGDVRFEPSTALIAKQQGLADLIQIASQARDYFSQQGRLFLEHGYDQGQAVGEILAQLGYQDITTIKDYGDNDRVTFACFIGVDTKQKNKLNDG
jgi:release factor glutamine methyltransferase